MRGKNRNKKAVKVRKDSNEASPDVSLPHDQCSCVTTIPKPVCTEFAAVPYADKVDMASMDDVLRCECPRATVEIQLMGQSSPPLRMR